MHNTSPSFVPTSGLLVLLSLFGRLLSSLVRSPKLDQKHCNDVLYLHRVSFEELVAFMPGYHTGRSGRAVRPQIPIPAQPTRTLALHRDGRVLAKFSMGYLHRLDLLQLGASAELPLTAGYKLAVGR